MKELSLYNRRSFIKKVSTVGALAGLGGLQGFAQGRPRQEIKLTILHTNDVHSRIEPFPMDGSRLQGLGGVARRSTLLKKIRNEENNVLLLDAGDMFQGTPYFNLFDGKVELELMSKMGYDAGTFGNHEFDNGLNGLLKHFDKANFPFITSNYDFSNTVLAGKTKEYLVLEKSGLRIGIFAVGIKLDGMVDPNNHKGVNYLEPIPVANRLSKKLRIEEHCDIVICLSHIGYHYQTDQVSDLVMASQTRGIDLIIGGHTHTFLDKPTEVKNLDGEITLVNQMGYGGVNLGRIDYYFDKKSGNKRYLAQHYTVDPSLPEDQKMWS
ncbi:bifunctional metallophosphatase/5'-nucleotidase [Sphingobacterium populi]|uniref:Bifunctional metallophosphatase/5'-nucleotidase n=1 Tax=Sphingobacterium populi TaxID=1812824 RepID=A0ABW5UIP0_9SPHI